MKYIGWLFCLPCLLFANPKGAEIVSGEAKLVEAEKRLEVHAADKTVLHWDHFSIGAGEATHFIQPGADSAVLNRVMEGVTQIDGLVKANGRVYLLNPKGVVIGKDGVVNASSFVASTLDLDNETFFKNHDLLFKGNSGAKIVNLGKIEALGGDVFLLAKAVLNEGTIEAEGGLVGMAAASEVLIKPEGEQRIFIAPKGGFDKEKTGIENKGLILAAQAELRADGNAYRFAINQEGVIEATTLVEKEGRVFLVAEGGTSINSGTISATPGGTVHILGDQVGLEGEALIDVSGDFGGGEVLIGGDFQGKNPEVLNSSMTVVQPKAHVVADAIVKGDGGRIICWSDGQTHVMGTLSANATSKGGDGGFIEVSGREFLSFVGAVETDAPMGRNGQLMLDPSQIEILPIAMNSGMKFDASKGTYTALGAEGKLGTLVGTETLKSVLDAGTTDVIVTTKNDDVPNGTGDIIVEPGLSWTTKSTLTLMADRDVLFKNGGGGTATDDGDFTVMAKRDIVVTEGNIIGVREANLTFQAGRDFKFAPANEDLIIGTNFGDVTISAGRDIVLGGTPHKTEVAVLTGAISMESVGNLILDASTGAGKEVLVLTGNKLNTFSVGGDLTLNGGKVADETSVLIGGGSSHSSMEFDVFGNVSVLGGTKSKSYAHIGLQNRAALPVALNGDITFRMIGGALNVIGGTGAEAFAQIGHLAVGSLTAILGTGNITLENVLGPITLKGDVGSGIIGFGNNFSESVDHYTGTITIDGRGGTTIVSTGAALAGVGFTSSKADGPTRISGSVFFSDRSLTMSASSSADGHVYIGGYATNGIALDGTLGLVQVNVRDDLVMNGGKADAAIGAFSDAGDALANVEVNVGNLTMNAPDTGLARILTSPEGEANGLTLCVTASDNLFIGNGGPGPETVQILGGGEVTLIAGDDMVIGPPALITNASGNVTLVVDSDHPSSPDVGGGRFVIDPGSILESAGLLRIYTAKRPQNSIGAPLNGAAYVPGTFFVNTATEQWGSYFAKDFGGTPFTLFYKTGLPKTTFNDYGRAIAEMLLDLKTYDDLLFQCKSFLFGYDKACYDQIFHPKGMLSSYDLFPKEIVETMLRQKYRNYHTKFVESF